MLKVLFFYFLLVLSVGGVQAASLEGCDATDITVSQDVKVSLWLHRFEDGGRDLVMSKSSQLEDSQHDPLKPTDIKRITFNHIKADGCPYQSLAIAEGINANESWGWYLAWADDATLYCARMDGEAWVSSVPKKIIANHAHEIIFEQTRDFLVLSWKTTDCLGYAMKSDDEGRSWGAPVASVVPVTCSAVGINKH